ncbi:MAG: hypothetical protein AAF514_10250, partial [Verrucomicrobiota bacterium]
MVCIFPVFKQMPLIFREISRHVCLSISVLVALPGFSVDNLHGQEGVHSFDQLPSLRLLPSSFDRSLEIHWTPESHMIGIFEFSQDLVVWKAIGSGVEREGQFFLTVTTKNLSPTGFYRVRISTVGEPVDELLNDGMEGGSVTTLRVAPSRPEQVYAGVDGDLYKSNDHGKQWSLVRSGAGRAIAIEPLDHNVVYGAMNGGIAKSTDAGTTWTTYTFPDPQVGVPTALAIDPKAPNLLLAGTYSGKVFRSSDSGQTWRETSSPPANRVTTIAIDPHNAHTMWLGTDSRGIYKSIDGGDTWVHKSEGLVDPGDQGRRVKVLFVDPNTPNLLIAATGSRVFKSTDNGERWDIASGSLGSGLWDMSTYDGKNIYTAGSFGIQRSTESPNLPPGNPLHDHDRDTFERVIRDVSNQSSAGRVAVDPTNPQRVYAGTSGDGVYWSINGGSSWTHGKGITSVAIDALGQDLNDSKILYAGSASSGVFRSTNSGATWKVFNTGMDQNLQPRKFVSTKSGLYLVTNNGLWKNTGQRWFRPDDGCRPEFGADDPFGRTLYYLNLTISALAVDPSNENTLYVGHHSLERGMGIRRSVDGGRCWDELPLNLPRLIGWARVNAIAIDPRNSNNIYATVEGFGVIKSSDFGETWELRDNGIRQAPLQGNPGHHGNTIFGDIVIDNNNTLYVTAGGTALFRSTDGAETWTVANTGLKDGVFRLALDPNDSSTVYGVGWSGFFKTTNKGDQWTQEAGSHGFGENTLFDVLPTADGILLGSRAGVIRLIFSLIS